jgi:transposase
VHSRYRRSLADLAIGGRMVEIVVRVRRWRCTQQECPAVTFAEQVDGLTTHTTATSGRSASHGAALRPHR